MSNSFLALAAIAAAALCVVSAAEPAATNSTCDKTKCPNYIFSHYDGKGCSPVIDQDGCCPTHFDCGKFNAPKDAKACVYKGKEFAQGEPIVTTNPCHKCNCGPNPSINCGITDCFQERPDPGCVPLFDHSSCCPKGFKCLSGGEPDGVTCKYDDKVYVEGQIMIMKEDPCMQCLCDANFKGPNSPSCRALECNFPGHAQRLKSGCIPVYFENQCCYIDWHCPPPTEDGKPHTPSVDKDTCAFGILTFARGEQMDLGDPCVSCSCNFPPDLTCVRTRCRGPPPGVNPATCRTVPKPGQCCPEFQCGEEQEGPQQPGGEQPQGPPQQPGTQQPTQTGQPAQ